METLRQLEDEEVEAQAAKDPDAPLTDKEFWKAARVIMPPSKTKISLYLDSDVLAWFKAQGRGYQTRVNAVLRSYMQAASR